MPGLGPLTTRRFTPRQAFQRALELCSAAPAPAPIPLCAPTEGQEGEEGEEGEEEDAFYAQGCAWLARCCARGGGYFVCDGAGLGVEHQLARFMARAVRADPFVVVASEARLWPWRRALAADAPALRALFAWSDTACAALARALDLLALDRTETAPPFGVLVVTPQWLARQQQLASGLVDRLARARVAALVVDCAADVLAQAPARAADLWRAVLALRRGARARLLVAPEPCLDANAVAATCAILLVLLRAADAAREAEPLLASFAALPSVAAAASAVLTRAERAAFRAHRAPRSLLRARDGPLCPRGLPVCAVAAHTAPELFALLDARALRRAVLNCCGGVPALLQAVEQHLQRLRVPYLKPTPDIAVLQRAFQWYNQRTDTATATATSKEEGKKAEEEGDAQPCVLLLQLSAAVTPVHTLLACLPPLRDVALLAHIGTHSTALDSALLALCCHTESRQPRLTVLHVV